MIENPRIVFAGTPEFAAVYLQALIDAGYPPVAVYTQPDRRAGRGKKLSPSVVKQVALEYQIEVFQPLNFKSEEAVEQLSQLKPDLLVVVAYGLLLPQSVLDIPKLGCINAHASLLPRWRGAAPIQRAIEAGDKKSGVCIMQIELGLDTGPVLAQVETSIDGMTAAELHDRLATDGSTLLVDKLPQILASELPLNKQNDALAVYARKLTKQEAKINWNLPALELEKQIRAFNSWPVSHFQLEDKVIRVWEAEVKLKNHSKAEAGTIIEAGADGIQIATAEGVLSITALQMPGKKMMPVQQILLGQSETFKVGIKLK